ncbi:hypothetical protein GOP47_0030809, partial [Adiantum capillus-veneris]
ESFPSTSSTALKGDEELTSIKDSSSSSTSEMASDMAEGTCSWRGPLHLCKKEPVPAEVEKGCGENSHSYSQSE